MTTFKKRSTLAKILDYILLFTIIYPIIMNFVYGYRWYKWAFHMPKDLNNSERIKQIQSKQNIDHTLWTNVKKETFKLEVTESAIIVGKLFIVDEKSTNFVFLHHGWTGNMETNLNIAEPYLRNGVNVIVYNSRGQNNVSGTLSLGFKEADDLYIVIKHFMDLYKIDKFAIAGISMGAATVLRFTVKYHDSLKPEFVVFDSGYCSLKWQVKHVLKTYYHIPWFYGYFGATIITRLKEGFFLGLFTKTHEIKKISDVPFLIIHSREDLFVPIHHSEVLEKHHKGKKLTLFVDKGEHGVVYDLYTKKYINLIDKIIKEVDFKNEKTI